MRRKFKIPRKRALIIGLPVVIIVALGVYGIWQSIPTPADKFPVRGILDSTIKLQEAATEITDGRSQDPAQVQQAYKEYMRDLDSLITTCADIKKYVAAAKEFRAPTGITKQLYDNSEAMCNDLQTLALDSSRLYAAISPVYDISGSTKRYQTLPLVNNFLIRQHNTAVQQSITNVTAVADSLKTDDFTTQIPTLLNQLQSDMKNAEGFSYRSNIQLFQVRALAEQQQYWNAYAGINLATELTNNQINSYCNEFAPNPDIRDTCEPRT